MINIRSVIGIGRFWQKYNRYRYNQKLPYRYTSNTDIIYFDFSKAFDTVPHLRLLHKLEVYGIKDKLLMWFKNFLVGRQQCVVLNNIQSSWSIVTSGVPQGSVLGPLLFTIFVNDIPHIVRSDIYLFADDIKLSRTIKNSDDILILQDDIHKLFE